MARPRVRNRILDAALQQFEDEGIAGIRTKKVAERAGVTEASVFNNFGDKAGLVGAMIDEVFPQQQALLDSIEKDVDDLASWLEEVVDRAINFFKLVLPFVTTAAVTQQPSPGLQRMTRFLKPRIALEEKLLELQQSGVCKTLENTTLAVRLIMGLATHTAMTELALGNTFSREVPEGKQLVAMLGMENGRITGKP